MTETVRSAVRYPAHHEMLPSLSLIVARSANNVIGLNGTMPWDCPEDLKHFKAVTQGHCCLAGFDTYTTLPENGLPNRTLYVLTRKKLPDRNHVFFIKDLPHFLYELRRNNFSEEFFCIGGLSLYEQCIPFASKVYLTEIKRAYAGDTFFPNDLLIGFKPQLVHETEQCAYYIYKRENGR